MTVHASVEKNMVDRGHERVVPFRSSVMKSSTISIATRILRLLWINFAGMRTLALACLVASCVCGVHGFVGSPVRSLSARSAVRSSSSIRMAEEVTVADLLKQTERLKILSTASNLGLLSKLEKAGLSLKDVERLLPLVDENDLIGVAQVSAPTLLSVAPAALDVAPSALPLLSAALDVPAAALFVGAVASLAAGAAVVYIVPENSVLDVALQTFVAIPLVLVLPAVLGVSGFLLSSLKNGKLVDFLTASKPAPAPKATVSAPAPVSVPAVSFSVGPSKPPSPAPVVAKKSGGRPTGGGRPSVVATPKPVAAPAPKVKASAPKAPPKPTSEPAPPKGNIKNLPKAL